MGVLGKIESRLSAPETQGKDKQTKQHKDNSTGAVSANLMGLALTTDDKKKNKQYNNVINKISKDLNDFNKELKNIDVVTLDKLIKSIDVLEKAPKDKIPIASRLGGVTYAAKEMGSALLLMGMGVLLFTGAIVLGARMLGIHPIIMVPFMIISIAGIALAMLIVSSGKMMPSFLSSFIGKKMGGESAASTGTSTNRDGFVNAMLMGAALGVIGLGIITFSSMLALSARVLDTTILGVGGIILGAIVGITLAMLIINAQSLAASLFPAKLGGLKLTKPGVENQKNTLINAGVMGAALGVIGLGVLIFSGSLALSATMLDTTVLGVGGIILGAIVGITLAMHIINVQYLVGAFVPQLAMTKSTVENQKNTLINAGIMGAALGVIGLGILIFSGSLALSANILDTTVLGVGGIILAAVVGISLSMAIISGKTTKTKVANQKDTLINAGIMGAVLGVIGLGILIFSGSLALSANILDTTLLGVGGVLLITVAGLAGIMFLLGKGLPLVTPGILTAKGIGTSLLLLAAGVMVVALSSKILLEMFKTKNPDGTKESGGVLGNALMGLGVFGIFVAGVAGMMWLMGMPFISAPIMLGAGSLLFMSVGLITMSTAIKRLQGIIQEMGGNKGLLDLRTNISMLISGVTGGVIRGIVGGTSDNDINVFSVRGMIQFARIMQAIRMLSKISKSLSSFAQGLKAFAKLGEIASLDYDENLKPKLSGDKIHIESVVKSLVGSLSLFLNGLINGTENLTKSNASRIRRLGRLLGSSGLLKGISSFATTLDQFAKVASDGSIWVPPQYTDEAQKNMVPGTGIRVPILKVIDIIVNSLDLFIIGLVKATDGFSKAHLKSIRRVSKALGSEQGGILHSIHQFASTLKMFAEMGDGDNLWIPVQYQDEEQKIKVPGTGVMVPIPKVVDSIITTFGSFISGLVQRTDGFSKAHLKSIRRVSKALGSEQGGILHSIHQFAGTLKMFAEMGDGNNLWIPVQYQDEEQKIKVPGTGVMVPIQGVVNSIITTFTSFIDKLSSNVDKFKISGSLGKKMATFNAILVGGGKNRGMLNGLTEFSKLLSRYARFGKDGEIPVYDKSGKLIDKVKIDNVIENIVAGLSTFIDKLNSNLGKIKLSKNTIKNVNLSILLMTGIFKQFDKLSRHRSGIDKLSTSVGNLATNINSLVQNIQQLDVNKLNALATISTQGSLVKDKVVYSNNKQRTQQQTSMAAGAAGKAAGAATTQQQASTGTQQQASMGTQQHASTGTQQQLANINWDLIADKMGNRIAEIVSKKVGNVITPGEFEFTFYDGLKGGKLELR